ncbi:MAG: class II fumarate hydratase [Candidatus Micrarchaeota archaeon]|nr:class II fumarate hydratase [Candidatus Micrarchaeota archaeon]
MWMRNRIESDVLGNVRIPYDAYYGSETQRALNNFKISQLRMQPELIKTYAMVKLAAALANMRLGKLDRTKGRAISRACTEIIHGKFADQFTVDVFQAGAGTSTNMNVNEVVANRAIEFLGGKRGNYRLVHPNDHVNMSQSTNDTMPSVIRIATYLAIRKKLMPSLNILRGSLHQKATGFEKVVKIGRTHLEDAVPIRLGQEFSGYAGAVERSIRSLEAASSNLLELPLGGTAVGTGINAGPMYTKQVMIELGRITRARFTAAKNIFNLMQSRTDELEASNAITEAAVSINKIANDFRLLNSGPRAGIGDIVLPAVQPGSSIMPGKINPSIAEMVNMVCFQVMGSNETIKQASEAGQLEINVFMPVIAYNLLFSIEILSNASRTFEARCIKGIRANTGAINQHLERNLSLATALTPVIGYKKASRIARVAYLKNKTVKQVCLEMKVLDEKTLDRLLDPHSVH